jgi:hypothetical protein
VFSGLLLGAGVGTCVLLDFGLGADVLLAFGLGAIVLLDFGFGSDFLVDSTLLELLLECNSNHRLVPASPVKAVASGGQLPLH